MSQIRSFDEALDFYPARKVGLRSRLGGYLHNVRLFWEAMAEAYAASRRYHELRQRGVPHDQAASQVFAVHFR